MSNRVFAPHGEFVVHIEGRVLYMNTRGPWNKELIDLFGETMASALDELAGAPWGLLATVREEGMHTPDSYAAMVEGIRRQRALGRCATAVILDHVFGEPMVQSVLERMYRDAGETAAFFRDEEKAKSWLFERIAAAGS